MAKLIECVPNFSEGRDEDLIKQIVCEIERIRDVILLDKEMDADHNRSVITLVGDPEGDGAGRNPDSRPFGETEGDRHPADGRLPVSRF